MGEEGEGGTRGKRFEEFHRTPERGLEKGERETRIFTEKGITDDTSLPPSPLDPTMVSHPGSPSGPVPSLLRGSFRFLDLLLEGCRTKGLVGLRVED